MRWRFADVRADRKFDARIDELREHFNDEARLSMILADANLVSEQSEEILGGAPPTTKTRERIRKPRR